jgi:hypothetical protein
MVIELATLSVTRGRAPGFESAMRKGVDARKAELGF